MYILAILKGVFSMLSSVKSIPIVCRILVMLSLMIWIFSYVVLVVVNSLLATGFSTLRAIRAFYTFKAISEESLSESAIKADWSSYYVIVKKYYYLLLFLFWFDLIFYSFLSISCFYQPFFRLYWKDFLYLFTPLLSQ